MKLFIYSTEYNVLMAIAENVEQAKKLILKEKTRLDISYDEYAEDNEYGKEWGINDWDIQAIEKVLLSQVPVIIEITEPLGKVFGHSNP